MSLPSSLELVIDARARTIGPMTVGRVLPERRRRHVGPFVFLDHMGPLHLPPGQAADVLPHPHIGLSTVTYLFAGELVHRDSLGSLQPITPGAINLMTAGRGIVHSERASPEARAAGQQVHGLQFWTALPTALEDSAPSFHHQPAASLPAWRTDDAALRLLVGAALGQRSPAADPSGAVLLEVELAAGARWAVPSELAEAAVYLVEGEVAIDGLPLTQHQLAVRAADAAPVVMAASAARVMVLGGPPLDGPRLIDWNFVATSHARIGAAQDAWRAQTFPRIPGDDQEYVPLPSERSERR